MSRIDTAIIHAGEPRPGIEGSVCVPIFQSAIFGYESGSDYNDLKYLRLNNSPNHLVLHAKLAALEEAEAALVTASGMAAISTGLLATLSPGDHLLVQNCLYGGTHGLIHKLLHGMNIQTDVLDDDPAKWDGQVRENTRAVYTESLTNPTLRVIDHEAVGKFAARHDLIAMIDSTFATPVNFKPIKLGYHLIFHSATKYLNGHSDLVAGAVIGRADLVEATRLKLNLLGGSLDPHACFLLHRGLKTLGVRVRFQNESTHRIAEFLAGHDAVARVNYPTLPDHPDHALAERFFQGCCGVLSFELKPEFDADALIERMKLPQHTFSLGGVETLIIRPATTSHAGMSAQDRAASGISDGLIRLAVGLEDPDDLIDDFRQALAALS